MLDALCQFKPWIGLLSEGTQEAHSHTIRNFFSWAGHQSPESVTVDNCYQYLAVIKDRGLSDRSIKRYFNTLRRGFRFLVETDRVRRNPWNGVLVRFREEPSSPHQLIPVEHIRAIFRWPKGETALRDLTLFNLMLGGGLRIHETVGLNAEHVKIIRGIHCVWIGHSKTGETGWHSLPKWAGEVVLSLAEKQLTYGPKTPLIAAWGDRRMTTHNARVIFQRACKEACGVRYTPHSCRATAVTTLLSDGVPIEIVQIFSRHKKIESVIEYDKRRKGIEDNPGLGLDYSTA